MRWRAFCRTGRQRERTWTRRSTVSSAILRSAGAEERLLWSADSARGGEFSDQRTVFSPIFIHALRLVKYAAAVANEALGLLDSQIAGALRDAAREVVAGKHDNEFVVDIFQTGSGTSTNMNANEVIANRALELMGKKLRRQGHTP